MIGHPIACLVALLITASVLAEEQVVPLPADGTWVRYHMVHRRENGEELVAQVTLKFLGGKLHNSVPCRWVEITETYRNHPPGVHQFLVPESALRKSENPFSDTVAYNQRNGDGEVRPSGPERAGILGFYLLFLPGTLKNTKVAEEPQMVAYPQGKFVIPKAYRGEFRWSREAITITQTQTFVFDYAIWLAPELPVGIAKGRFQGRAEFDGVLNRKWMMDLYLEDFGTDAKPVFAPE
jgi:hypothetical protein